MIPKTVLNLTRDQAIRFADKADENAQKVKAEFIQKLATRSLGDLVGWDGEKVIRAETIASRAADLRWEATLEGATDEGWAKILQGRIEGWISELLRGNFLDTSSSSFGRVVDQVQYASMGAFFDAVQEFVWDDEVRQERAKAVEAAGGEEAYQAKELVRFRMGQLRLALGQQRNADLYTMNKQLGMGGGRKDDMIERLLGKVVQVGGQDGIDKFITSYKTATGIDLSWVSTVTVETRRRG